MADPVERIECGECGDALPVERFTALSELAEALEAHTSRCRAFS